MLYPFLHLAMVAPGRQGAFRQAVVVHLLVLAAGVWVICQQGLDDPRPFLGHLAMLTGIVEGATLLGWRLTQMPKSQALEFLLVTPLRPPRVYLAEAGVGLGRLALVTLAGLPLLAGLTSLGHLLPADLLPLLLMPWTWGAITGIGLTTWAYEPLPVRRWGERFVLVMILVYLVVGVLAAERLESWLRQVDAWSRSWYEPLGLGAFLYHAFKAFHHYNPFSVLQYWLEASGLSEAEAEMAWQRVMGMEAAALLLLGVLLLRSSARLQGHFHERHYKPVLDRAQADTRGIRDRPLSWWAVRRVMEYSGRVNLWLAGGFGVLYAIYTVAGAGWPTWLGRGVFQLCEANGGIPAIATALVVLAAVPAAFQYGLWDSNTQDRCRRLELLLLTELEPADYWNAAAAAAWRRGRGYFFVACLLWGADLTRHGDPLRTAAALATGILLWGAYFALGFRAFARGMQANGLGSLLTLGLPGLSFALFRFGLPQVGALLPPGMVYGAGAGLPGLEGLAGPMLAAAGTLIVGRRALANADADLRRWYDQHHGQKVLD